MITVGDTQCVTAGPESERYMNVDISGVADCTDMDVVVSINKCEHGREWDTESQMCVRINPALYMPEGWSMNIEGFTIVVEETEPCTRSNVNERDDCWIGEHGSVGMSWNE
jgi:hypothetical protein